MNMKTVVVKLSSGLDLIGQSQSTSSGPLPRELPVPNLTLHRPMILQVVMTPHHGPVLNMSPFRLFSETDLVVIHRLQYLDVYEPPSGIEQQYLQIVSGIAVAPSNGLIHI